MHKNSNHRRQGKIHVLRGEYMLESTNGNTTMTISLSGFLRLAFFRDMNVHS